MKSQRRDPNCSAETISSKASPISNSDYPDYLNLESSLNISELHSQILRRRKDVPFISVCLCFCPFSVCLGNAQLLLHVSYVPCPDYFLSNVSRLFSFKHVPPHSPLPQISMWQRTLLTGFMRNMRKQSISIYEFELTLLRAPCTQLEYTMPTLH